MVVMQNRGSRERVRESDLLAASPSQLWSEEKERVGASSHSSVDTRSVQSIASWRCESHESL